ncbi:MAG: hypothetical protein AAB670_02450 [Patescibacteria group bacterium]
MQQVNTLFIVVIVIAVGALGVAGYFYTQHSSLRGEAKNLNQQLSRLQNEKTKIETELAVLKATDLVKEAEVLTLKLTTAGKDLSAVQKDLATAEKARSDIALDLYRLKNNLAKIPAYLNAIDAIGDVPAQGPTRENVAVVDVKIAILKDDAVSSRWQAAKASIDIEKKSWMGGSIADTVRLITLTIGKLISP